MECPYCNQHIDNDAIFCDQCGKAMMICPVCKKPGKGKACIYDGNKLISAAELSNHTSPTSKSLSSDSSKNEPTLPFQEQHPNQLCLTNSKLGIQINITDGDIVGRKSGNHAKAFANLNQISGAHARFNFTNNQWMVTDLNSTNGTKIAQQQRNWDSIPPLVPNQPTPVVCDGFLLLANIEFMVSMEIPDKSDKTQRVIV